MLDGKKKEEKESMIEVFTSQLWLKLPKKVPNGFHMITKGLKFLSYSVTKPYVRATRSKGYSAMAMSRDNTPKVPSFKQYPELYPRKKSRFQIPYEALKSFTTWESQGLLCVICIFISILESSDTEIN